MLTNVWAYFMEPKLVRKLLASVQVDCLVVRHSSIKWATLPLVSSEASFTGSVIEDFLNGATLASDTA
jgi:hypothetical protein